MEFINSHVGNNADNSSVLVQGFPQVTGTAHPPQRGSHGMLLA